MIKGLIETERLELRKLKNNNIDLIFEFISKNKNYFEKWDPVRSKEFYTIDGQSKRLEKLMKDNTQIKFYIFKKGNHRKIIGEIGISNIVRGAFQNCTIGYKLDQEEVGNGYMEEALKAILKYVFEELELHRIEANIIPRNIRSIKLIEGLGFENEGLSKEFLRINDKWEDHYRYAKRKS